MGRAKARLMGQVLGRGGVVSTSVMPSQSNEGPGVSGGVQLRKAEGENPFSVAVVAL